MKFYSRLLLICISICCMCKTASAQLDYSVYNFEEIHKILQDGKFPSALLKGFEPGEDDEALLFKNAGNERLYIYTDGDDVTRLRFVTQRSKLQRIAHSLSADKRYVNTTDHLQKINGQDLVNKRFTYGKCIYITRESDNTFELYVPAGETLPPAKSVVAPTPTPATPPAKYNPASSVMSNKRFPDIKTFIKIMNRNIESAAIVENNPVPADKVGKSYSKKNIDYKFTLLGKTDRINSSLEFVEKEGKLYLRIFLPKEGNCVSGLFDIEAENGRVKGWGSEIFSIKSFKYDRKCGGNIFNTITVDVYHNGDEKMSEDVNDWLRANTE